MSYPIESLAIIAPAIFLVLMIGVPAIGVLAGWKRAAYWGGGTFLFFIIGLIVWSATGGTIAAALKGLVKGLMPSGVEITDKLVISVVAPLFFMVVMMVGELLLLINYYAWFKRVAKIKRDVAIKKAYKEAKLLGKKPNYKDVKMSGWSQMQLTTKGKIINMACGGAGMALLLAPSSITFTQAMFYMTTSSATRTKFAFAANLYASLEKTAKAFNWMSYYGDADTGKDFDSLLSALQLTLNKITYIGLDGNPVEKTAIEALGDTTANGISNIIKEATSKASEGTTAQVKAIGESVTSFANSWNSIIDSAGDNVEAVFQSENMTEAMKSVIPSIIGESKTKVTVDEVQKTYGEDSIFGEVTKQITEGYDKEGETITISIQDTKTGKPAETTIPKVDSIAVTQESFDNIKESFKGSMDLSDLEPTTEDTPEQKAAKQQAKEDFDKALTNIVSLLFYVKK